MRDICAILCNKIAGICKNCGNLQKSYITKYNYIYITKYNYIYIYIYNTHTTPHTHTLHNTTHTTTHTTTPYRHARTHTHTRKLKHNYTTTGYLTLTLNYIHTQHTHIDLDSSSPGSPVLEVDASVLVSCFLAASAAALTILDCLAWQSGCPASTSACGPTRSCTECKIICLHCHVAHWENALLCLLRLFLLANE